MKVQQRLSAARCALMLGLSLVATSPKLMAQAVYGSIVGTVTDNTGAAVPKANVTVVDVNKGTSITVTTNESGEFTADHLIPDTYNVKVETQGFKSFQQSDIRVFADNSVKVAAALTVGSAGETVNVSADQVPLLKTDRADVSTEFTSQEIVNLPIPDRNFTNLQLLLPGAQQLGWSHAASEDPQGSKQIEVDGQIFAGTAFELDGTDNQDPILGIIVINPNPDSLSETKISTQNFDAEFGKAVSSVVTAQTKSGTNSFHGTVFDYRQSNANLARDPFTQGPSQLSATNPFPGGLKNAFGGSIGGPILKNHIFFFGDYQGVRQKVGIANVQTVPTAHLVQTCLGQVVSNSGIPGCDFNEYANGQIGNFATSSKQLIYQPNSPNAFTNNVIPTSQVSAQSLAFLKLLVPYAPNTEGTLNGLKNNYARSGTGGFNSDQWDVRGDWTVSPSTHAFGRFSRFTDVLTGTTMFGDAGGAGFGLGGYGGTSKGANDSAAAGVDIALTPKLVTDIRLGYFRYGINTSKYDTGTDLANQLGIPGLNTGNTFTSGAPGIEITEVGSFGAESDPTEGGPQYGSAVNINRCNCPLVEHEDQFQLANNWTRTLGNHELKFGADLRYARNLRVPSDANRTGELRFGTGPTSGGNSTSGLGFATFMLGDVTTMARYVSTSTNAKEFQKRDFFFAQDTWRPSGKLTVNLGLRYELYFPESVNGKGNGALLNLDTGYLQVAGYGNIGSNMNWAPSMNGYAPRIGFAYSATPTTVIRGGYGRSFDIGVFGSIFGHSATQNLPVLANQSATATNGDNATDTAYAFNLADGPPAPAALTVPANGLLPALGNQVTSRTRPTTLRLPTLDAWNLSVQQSLTPTLSVTVAYVGNKGTHTLGDYASNATNPNESGIVLPSQYSVTGNTLHYDPSVASTDTSGANGIAGVTGISANGGTANQTYLSRYYGGKLAACSDPVYVANGGTLAPNGGCGWNQGITYFSDDLDTHFNALQASISKQMAHGYSLNANYSWQQAISEQTGFSTWSRPAVRGRDSNVRPQQVIVYGIFQLPFGRNKALLGHAKGIVNQLVSGFEIDPVVNYSSGLPFTLCSSSSQHWVPGSAPCYLSGDNYSFHSQPSGFPGNGLTWYPAFTPDASGTLFTAAGEGTLTAPALDQIGNLGRNSQFGPHFFNTDISVMKNFPIRESVQLQVRADGFNAFNHINWGTPNNGPTTLVEQGGSITCGAAPNCSASPRQLQFSARVQF